MSQPRTRKRDLADRLVLLVNVLVLFCLALSYLAGIISPIKFWPFAFVAMSYPIILGITVVFMLYWLVRTKWWFLALNLCLLLFKADYVTGTFQLKFGKKDTQGIKVMTYNVRLFDRYNWSKDRRTRSRAQEFIFNQQPNILCIQEFYNPQGDKFRAIDTLSAGNSIKHIHTENYSATKNSKNQLGLATLTSYPILNKGKINFENSKSALVIFTDVLIDSDTVRIYNLHLQSIHLGNKGYAVLDEIIATKDLEDVNDGKVVLSRMKNGFNLRAKQANIVAEHIASSPYSVIVCGDFNDVPTSYTYQTIANGLEDSFSQSGSGLGTTYVRVPFFRIDNILYSKQFEAKSHTVHPYELSDHLAVTTTLNKNP